MNVGLERICTHLHCASECTHSILRKLRFVPSVSDGLRSPVTRHIFSRICKGSWNRMSIVIWYVIDLGDIPLGKSLLGPSSGCSTILSSCFVRPSNTGGTPTTMFSRIGVCTSKESSKFRSAMICICTLQLPTAPLANNFRQDQRADEAGTELSGIKEQRSKAKHARNER